MNHESIDTPLPQLSRDSINSHCKAPLFSSASHVGTPDLNHTNIQILKNYKLCRVGQQ